MRAQEFFTEDAKIKSIVIRSLGKMPDDSPIFNDVYKQIVNKPLGGRMERYIQNRGDADAIKAVKWLVTAIPTLGTVEEVKTFMEQFADPQFDPIDTEELCPDQGMTQPKSLESIVKDPFAKKLFAKIFAEFGGKVDAGPGEAALAILSPNITYGSPGDIVVNSKKVEVKAARGPRGQAGRIWDTPVNQKPMLQILAQIGMSGFNVLDGEQPFPEASLAKIFITTACTEWFGKPISNIIKSFGKVGFKNIWQAEVFDTYKEHGGWNGCLALGNKTYQYIVSGTQFAQSMKKSQQGSLCRASAKQSRELAPQILIM
jgi:hypothetical protein